MAGKAAYNFMLFYQLFFMRFYRQYIYLKFMIADWILIEDASCNFRSKITLYVNSEGGKSCFGRRKECSIHVKIREYLKEISHKINYKSSCAGRKS